MDPENFQSRFAVVEFTLFEFVQQLGREPEKVSVNGAGNVAHKVVKFPLILQLLVSVALHLERTHTKYCVMGKRLDIDAVVTPAPTLPLGVTVEAGVTFEVL